MPRGDRGLVSATAAKHGGRKQPGSPPVSEASGEGAACLCGGHAQRCSASGCTCPAITGTSFAHPGLWPPGRSPGLRAAHNKGLFVLILEKYRHFLKQCLCSMAMAAGAGSRIGACWVAAGDGSRGHGGVRGGVPPCRRLGGSARGQGPARPALTGWKPPGPAPGARTPLPGSVYFNFLSCEEGHSLLIYPPFWPQDLSRR